MAELGALYYDSVSLRSNLSIEMLKGFKSRIKCIEKRYTPSSFEGYVFSPEIFPPSRGKGVTQTIPEGAWEEQTSAHKKE
jgi:hypothetical protein